MSSSVRPVSAYSVAGYRVRRAAFTGKLILQVRYHLRQMGDPSPGDARNIPTYAYVGLSEWSDVNGSNMADVAEAMNNLSKLGDPAYAQGEAFCQVESETSRAVHSDGRGPELVHAQGFSRPKVST